MKKLQQVLCTIAGLLIATAAHAQVRISQVYGAGGLNAAQPNADYVELFNPNPWPVDMAGWSLQFNNDFLLRYWVSVPIAGTIQPGAYFLVRTSPKGTVGTPLPTPDFVASTPDFQIISPVGMHAALIEFEMPMPHGYCPASFVSSVDDQVSWGDLTPCAEGGVLGPPTSASAPFQAIHRRGAGCRDTNVNGADLVVGAPTPRNSASAPNASSYFVPAATTSTANAGSTTPISFTFETCPSGTPPTLSAVTGDFSAFGLGTRPLTQNGTDWTYQLAVPVNQASNTYTINITGVSGAATYPGTTTLRVVNPVPPNDTCAAPMVLNQAAMPQAISVDINGAGPDTRPGTCTGSQTQGLYGTWYVFSPTTEGTLLYRHTSAYTMYTGIWTNASCGSLDPALAACLTASDWGYHVMPGNTYLIEISLKSATGAPVAGVPLAGTFEFYNVPPPNDDCVTAIDVTSMMGTPTIPPAPIFANNVFARNDAPGSVLQCPATYTGTMPATFTGKEGMWYRFDAPAAGSVGLWRDFASGNGNGPRFAIWSVPTGTPVSTACGQIMQASSGSVGVEVCSDFGFWTLPVQAATTYYFMMLNGNYGNGLASSTPTSPQTLYLMYTQGTPSNDDCTGAMDLSAAQNAPLSIRLDNSLANHEPASMTPCDPTPDPLGRTFGVWFKYTATQTGSLLMEDASSQAVTASVWEVPTPTSQTDACASFTGNNVRYCAGFANMIVSVQAGKTYYFLMMNASPTSNSPPMLLDFIFNPDVPPNDTCAGATDIAPLLGTTIETLATNAGVEIPSPCGFGTAERFGVWYKLAAQENGLLLAEELSDYTISFSVYAPTSNDCADISASTEYLCTSYDSMAIPVNGGQTYFIRVAMDNNIIPVTPYKTLFTLLPDPPNDLCAGAVDLPGTGEFYFHNVINPFSSPSPAEVSPVPCPTNADTLTRDSWYRWVAPATGPTSFQVLFFPIPWSTGRMAIYRGNGTGTNGCPTDTSTLVRCLPFQSGIGSAHACFPDSAATSFSPNAGEVYYIQFANMPPNDYMGHGVIQITQAPSATGRCCLAASCLITSPAQCATLGGLYGGDGTACTDSSGGVQPYFGGGGPISDSTGVLGGAGIFSSTITVPGSFSLDNVEVDLSISHPAQDQLRITLSNGIHHIVLSDRSRRGYTPGDVAKALVATGNYRFSDAGTQSFFSAGNLPGSTLAPGVYRPAAAAGISPGFRNTFNGDPAAGNWTLTIADEDSSGVGTLNGWVLRLKGGNSGGCGPVCDPIDFNGDELFPDTADIDDFLTVFSGGPCSNDPNCHDIDFNNDDLFPDTLDIDSLLSVFSGGPCL
ncbi:MAG: lamin tail domain-containing protein [Phycisphaerales bacterium]